MNWVSILGSISIWIILVPLLIGVASYSKLNYDSKLILSIVLIGTLPQVLRPFINNSSSLTLLYNLYTPSEFIVYYFLFIKKVSLPYFKNIFVTTAVFFLLASLFFIFKQGLLNRFINEWVIINNIFQIIWICLCLMEYYKTEDSVIETNQPFFWFLIGITAYSTCTVVFYSLWYFIKSDSGSQTQILKIIHHIFNIALYVFFSIGLFKNYTLKHLNNYNNFG